MLSVLLLASAQALSLKEQYLDFLTQYGSIALCVFWSTFVVTDKTWRDSGFAAFQENVKQTQNRFASPSCIHPKKKKKKKTRSTTHGIGPFFDLTAAEFRELYLSPVKGPYNIITESNTTAAPPSVDWRVDMHMITCNLISLQASGVVPPVWDQGQEGSRHQNMFFIRLLGDPIHFVTADNLVPF